MYADISIDRAGDRTEHANHLAQRVLPVANNVVVDELEWRVLRQPVTLGRGLVASRWQAVTLGIREARAETPLDGSVVKIILRQMNFRFTVAGRTIHDGLIMPGTIHVAEPGTPVKCLFRGSHDVVHLHVPDALLGEYVNAHPAHTAPAFSTGGQLVKDHVVEQLARTLLLVAHHGQFDRLYADCVNVAIVARILGADRKRPAGERGKVSELPAWRLKRAIDYFEAHLAEPVPLADVASVTGVTRMHFAAQFRAATGLSPHQYLLRRRIDRAQELLANDDMSLFGIALSVGFQNQSHFTTVFKRFAGHTPDAWRRSRSANSKLH